MVRVELPWQQRKAFHIAWCQVLCECLANIVFIVCRAAEWRTTPTDGQYEVGSEVILSCELDNLNINLPPSWALLTEGAATATTITDGTNIATEFNDLVELVGDQNNGEWNLKIKSISFDQQGEYSCTSLASDPQKQSATIGVWAPVKSVALTGGEDSTTVEVPKPDETFTYTRTCKVDNVKPVPKLTWTYSITSDNNLNVAGELPEDFEMGPLPDDDLPEGGINNIKVDTTSSENGDSTSNVASVLTVNYTSSSDNDGSADPNLKIVATCKVSQDPYVGDTLTMESSQLTVDVTPRVITTQMPRTTGSATTAARTTKGKEEGKLTEAPKGTTKPVDSTKEVSKEPLSTKMPSKDPEPKKDASKGGCTSGCVAGIVIALLIIAVGVVVLVIFFMRKRNGAKKLDNKEKTSKNKKDPPPVNV
ncbi:uncharacterized protein [Ptychodera flava]|uniref:uncharacterized protein n=1 Tax=Ptychodera flava TaxID=63121 RepID=UPI00396AA5CD